jgi:peptide/nickel transport system substrate-binding protein
VKTIFRTSAAISVAAIFAWTGTAHAQKSKDTVTMAFLEATQSIDPYSFTKAENNFLGRAVWGTLVTYDANKRQYAPLLAKSWKRVDDTTYEFDLRDDVKWTDGQPLTADDVVYTYTWATNPKSNLSFAADWSFIERTEKLGPYKIRIVTKAPTPQAMEVLSYRMLVFPKHIHEPLADKEAFGTKPVGSSMYRVTSVDRNKGVTMVKNPAYAHGGSGKPASNVGNFNVIPIPDFGTQTAQFLVGNVNLLRNVPLEQAEELAKDPRYAMTLAQGVSYVFMSLDAAGRTGSKILTDIRVRKAMMMAINRDEVYKIRTGKHPLPRGTVDALCWPFQEGCDFTTKPPAYDPAGAKKLLAEAGYPDGFDIQINTINTAKDMAEVVAGHLRKVGIRASIDSLSFVAYRQRQVDSRIQVAVTPWSGGSGPDIASTVNFFFDNGVRDYHRDGRLHELAQITLSTLDEGKRKAAARELFDRATEQAYIIPVAPIPLIFVHPRDLAISEFTYDSFGIRPDEINWK